MLKRKLSYVKIAPGPIFTTLYFSATYKLAE
jgi:hypothetical protein